MYRHFVKRTLDIVGAILLLPVLGLVSLLVIPMIWLQDKGPALYIADRLGQDQRIFRMYKFRSMRVNAPDLRQADGSTYNAADDPRLTKIGRLLRATSLDELPQLLNVLLGDMSIVGPRPDLPSQLSLYEGEEFEKLSVRPGITGYSQAFHRNSIDWKERIKLDVYYARNLSLLLDLRILSKTISTVLLRRNVYIPTDASGNKSENVRMQQKDKQG